MSEAVLATLARMRHAIGVRGLVEAALYPLLTPLFVIPAWLRSLWAARILLRGQWGRYHGFHPQNALNSFFYKTQWLNFERFGRAGTSPLVGLGDYPLGRWFHLSLLSSCLYANAGAATTLLGSLAWALMHLVWLDAAAAASWVLLVTLVVLFSSTAFAMAFTRQNYNILGWLWLPLALYATSQGLWALAALAWLAASLASITAVFAVLPLLAVQALAIGRIEPLLALLPALLKLGLHLLPLLAGGGLRPALRNMAKLIGLTSAGVRYRRTSMRLRPFNVYFILVYAGGCAALWLAYGVPVLPLTALALFAINQTLMRFADEQSLILLLVSVVAMQLLAAAPSWLGFAALLLVANPLPVFLGLCSFERDRSLVRTQTRRPFDHAGLQAAMEEFLSAVPQGQRILFAFEDPRGIYENLFDGYRTLIELPLFVAASRGVHLLPDWHAVGETNYEGAPQCWGRSLPAVLDNARRWKASHVIVYQPSGNVLEPGWLRAGFVLAGTFDWARWGGELEGLALWKAPLPPCWRLLKLPDDPQEPTS